MSVRGLSMALLAMAGLTVAAQQPPEPLPRFRSGANLVHVDAYLSKDGAALTDVRPDELEVFEDDKPQKIESVELIAARPSDPQRARRDPTTVGDMREMSGDPSARLFTLFFDTLHVSLSGSFHAQQPIVDTLDRVIGRDDMLGVMTPDMSAINITYSHRTSSIEAFLRDSWTWGEKDKLIARDPREDEIRACYPDANDTAGIAAEMILRRREQRALDALDGLVTHLEGLRSDRKFVLVFTEGWPLFQRSEELGRPLGGQVPGRDRVGTGPGGRLSTGPDRRDGTGTSSEACDRERVMLAFIDHAIEFRELLQRANRANVSFYPVDARGLVAFDSSVGSPDRPTPSPSLDAALLRGRYETLRTMALQTDGVAIVDTANVGAAMQRMLADVGSHYLLSYYSTNTKLDGRFRRISVRLERDGVDVRARPGYLAPSESEARAAGLVPVPGAGSRGTAAPPPATVTRALDSLAPARGALPVRIQASGSPGLVRAVVELDGATLKQTEWMAGGEGRLLIEPERGGGQPATIDLAFEPGQRSVSAEGPATALAPGRYSVKAELKPRNGRLPLQVTTFATVPPDTAAIGTAALALRRGPSTGLAYQATADPRFRRTERLRVEVPRIADGLTPTARVLTREGQPMPLVVTLSERRNESRHLSLTVAEVALAPLAEGEYVLEVSFAKGGKTDTVSYGFRLIP